MDCNHVRFYEGFNDEAQAMRRRRDPDSVTLPCPDCGALMNAVYVSARDEVSVIEVDEAGNVVAETSGDVAGIGPIPVAEWRGLIAGARPGGVDPVDLGGAKWGVRGSSKRRRGKK
jgi:hypothetical protein